jgi:hypothetical protein
LRKCWKCGKTGHYKKDCKSKKVEKPKGSDSTSSTEEKTSTEEGGDVYLASTGIHADRDVWLIDSGASYHMTPHREWFSKYEKYDGGDVFLGDDSTTGRKYVGSKWLFKKNFNAQGKVEEYKAQLVAKGYSQVEGIDFGEIFSPTAKLTSIRFILSIVVAFDLEVEQMDVKTTFLHGDLEEEIYMKQPEDFVVKGKKELVCKLKKSLYGLEAIT